MPGVRKYGDRGGYLGSGSSIMSVERLDAKFCTRPVCPLEEGHICDEFIS